MYFKAATLKAFHCVYELLMSRKILDVLLHRILRGTNMAKSRYPLPSSQIDGAMINKAVTARNLNKQKVKNSQTAQMSLTG